MRCRVSATERVRTVLSHSGAEGENYVRYWEDEKRTSEVMKKDDEGTLWMYTGDEGIMDEEGYLRSECLLPYDK